MAVTSGSDFWAKRLANYYAGFGRELGESLYNRGPFGVMTTVSGKLTGTAFGTVFRFGTGLVQGASGVGFLHDKTTSMAANLASAYKGSMTGAGRTGFAGGLIANTLNVTGQVIGGAVFQGVGNWGRFIAGVTGKPGEFGKSVSDLAKGLDKFFLRDMGPNDNVGLFGKKLRKRWGWSIPIGVASAGLGRGLFNYWDRFAASKAVNGPMDTEDVDLAPGAVNPGYSPLLPRIAQNRVPDDMGANAGIVLASHAARSRGWLR